MPADISWWESLGGSGQVALLGAAISFVGMGTTIAFSVRAFRQRKLDQQVKFLEFQQAYFNAVAVWVNQLSDILSEAVHLCDLDPSRDGGEPFMERKHKLRIDLSSMIDRGRLFFPNEGVETYGQHKPLAFRGIRQEILDSLVASYAHVSALSTESAEFNGRLKEKLILQRKLFISEAQAALNPRARKAAYDKIVGQIGVAENVRASDRGADEEKPVNKTIAGQR